MSSRRLSNKDIGQKSRERAQGLSEIDISGISGVASPDIRDIGGISGVDVSGNGLSGNGLSGGIVDGNVSDDMAINCQCCSSLLVHSCRGIQKPTKFKCSICDTTNVLSGFPKDEAKIPVLSFDYVESMVNHALNQGDEKKSLHEVFEPLSQYLYSAFKDINCVNNSFKVKSHSKHIHYSTSNLLLKDVRKMFYLLMKLPTRRPLYKALVGCLELSKRIFVFIDKDDARNFLWLLILLNIPLLNKSLVLNDSSKPEPKKFGKYSLNSLEIKGLCYEILKRCIGILSNSHTPKSSNYLASWFSKLSLTEFMTSIDLLNHFLTFHLKKYYHLSSNPILKSNLPRHSHSIDSDYQDYIALKQQSDEDLSSTIMKSLKKKPKQIKITIHQYGNDWRIKAAAKFLAIFIKANSIRDHKVSMSLFYNSLVDFVDLKLDFDSWQKRNNLNSTHNNLIDYIHGNNRKRIINERASYYFCQYPFLISLGGKILITEYEARRQMERKAEEAFINSLDKRVMIDVYFSIFVHRDRIIEDSLTCIKNNRENLKKTIRIKFIDEPGIDAGGLKKEWFLLLTRKLINPSAGMFVNNEDSNLLWFNFNGCKNPEMFYLFGAVLGLAIYNSTILDLQFPSALFKILVGKVILLEDYQQLYPITYKNLIKLKEMNQEEIEIMDLSFEVSYVDKFGKNVTKQLIENGSNIKVNENNLGVYIDKYYKFFMFDGIKHQVSALKTGFTNVVGGNGLSLYAPEEIELLLCGENSQIDFDTLQSVTKYYGWLNAEQAKTSQIIIWFWQYLHNIPCLQAKKFLMFVTGSDRVPATGIQNLSFRITLAGNDCNRLPTSHTCFNELVIYNYSSYEKLVNKLDIAVDGAAGFGLK